MTGKKSVILRLSWRNKLAFFVSLLSFTFLFPGVYLSMLTISSEGSFNAKIIKPNLIDRLSIKKPEKQSHLTLNILDTTRSILKTVEDLWDKGYFFVASMIFLFSVAVPVTKGLLLTYVFFNNDSQKRQRVFRFMKSIGKWSMCDVFIVAIFLSYLSTGAAKTSHLKNMVMMGYSVNVNVQTGMHAQLQIGFWCFLSYCLLSLLALQLYEPY